MHAYTRTPNHKRVHIVSQPESFLMEIHKINLQMAKRVNIVASYHSQTNGNVIMDTPLELAHTYTHTRTRHIHTSEHISLHLQTHEQYNDEKYTVLFRTANNSVLVVSLYVFMLCFVFSPVRNFFLLSCVLVRT